MNTKKIVLSRVNGKKKEVYIQHDTDIDKLDFTKFENIFKSQGEGDFERHCEWKLDEYNISVFGWKNGSDSKINKTEIPPPEDTDFFYGDIIFIKTINNKIKNFSLVDFQDFYDIANGGFESLGSEDSESDEDENENEYDSEDSFINNSDSDSDSDNDEDL
jgi:hypothetical protein